MAVLALVLALVGGVHKRHVEITSLDFDWTSAHDWELAQQLVGVRRKHKQDAAKLESWRTVSCSGRDKCELSVLHAQQLRYVRIFDSGNETISSMLTNGLRVHGESRFDNPQQQEDQKCWFTFVRDPIERFKSGYAHFERLLSEAMAGKSARRKYAGEMDELKFTFHKHALGSAGRAKAFIQDIVQQRWDIQNAEPAALWHRMAFAHVLPMTTATHGYSFDFVGRLSQKQFKNDWGCLQRILALRGERLPQEAVQQLHKQIRVSLLLSRQRRAVMKLVPTIKTMTNCRKEIEILA
eukprot:g1215.t1